MFNPNHYENSGPAGFPVLEVVPREASAARLFVPLRRTELAAEVAGPLADCRLTQVFAYNRQACDAVLEAVYRFPLPGDAAVTAVRVRFGDVEILAELKERERAEQEYEEARSRGKQAALAARESPDVFTLSVTGLQPDQEVRVETEYVQLARPEGAGWSLRLPLTTAPRYTRSDERESPLAAGQPLLVMRDPGHRFSLDLRFRGVERVRSATHAIVGEREDGAVRIRLREGEVLPDRDFVVTWQAEQEPDRPALRVLSEADPGAGCTYFMALAAPPAQPPAAQLVPREVILLVDHSGSMNGPKWEAADWAVQSFLAGLTEQDAFTLGVFHDRTRWFSRETIPAGRDAVTKAGQFLKKAHDSGGTELGMALEQALSINPAGGERARHLLIITDAEVTDAGRILRLADEEWGRSNRRRISLLCIDAAPNSFLAYELAERGGGVARFLTSDPAEADITTALDEVLADWSAPVLSGLSLEVNRADALATGRQARPEGQNTRIDLGDLPAGRALWTCGRAPSGDTPLEFRLLGKDGVVGAAATASPGAAGLKALFGARRVLALESLTESGVDAERLWTELERLGYDPAQVAAVRPGKAPRVYAENTRRDLSEALRALLVRESLEYGVASSATAFVAVRHEEGRLVDATVPVANALPSGWDTSFATVAQAPPGYGGVLYMAAAPLSVGLGAPMRMKLSAPADEDAETHVDFRAGMYDADDTQVAYRAVPRPSSARHGRPAEGRLALGVHPQLSNHEAVLFDSAGEPYDLPEVAILTCVGLRYPDGDPGDLDPQLALLVFVGDMAEPRARVPLQALARMGGERPLNVQKQAGDCVRIVLADPNGAWSAGAPPVELVLRWDG